MRLGAVNDGVSYRQGSVQERFLLLMHAPVTANRRTVRSGRHSGLSGLRVTGSQYRALHDSDQKRHLMWQISLSEIS